MTEEQWLTSDDPALLLCGLEDRVSARKAGLFDIACAWTNANEFPDPVCSQFLAAWEREVEGDPLPESELDGLNDAMDELARECWERFQASADSEGLRTLATNHLLRVCTAVVLANSYARMEWWYWLNDFCYTAAPSTLHEASESSLLDAYRDSLPVLRCIVGNPFRPVAFDSSWRTTTVTAIAEGVYADRAFDRLPVLADALEDAGCDRAELLAHLRGPGPHARGCWPVDLVLGKA